MPLVLFALFVVREVLALLVVLLLQVRACRLAIIFVSEVVSLARGLMLPTHSRLPRCGALALPLLESCNRAEILRLKCLVPGLVMKAGHFPVAVQCRVRRPICYSW